jgi:DNA uptake protein ComE-like DNA-binding protein
VPASDRPERGVRLPVEDGRRVAGAAASAILFALLPLAASATHENASADPGAICTERAVRDARGNVRCAGDGDELTQAEALLAGVPIDLRRATKEDLELLPEIGPGIAERIVRDRDARGPYRTIHDLDRVPGIGEKRLRAIARFVSAER